MHEHLHLFCISLKIENKHCQSHSAIEVSHSAESAVCVLVSISLRCYATTSVHLLPEYMAIWTYTYPIPQKIYIVSAREFIN